MGVSIREKIKGSDIWWIFIRHNGQRTSKKVGDHKTALEVAQKIQAKITLGDFGIQGKQTRQKIPLFKDYALLWLNDYVKSRRRQSTYERYKGILEHYIFPVMGKVAIDQVKRKDIRALLLDLFNKEYSKSTICLVRNVISGPLNYAIDDEIISNNPVNGITKMLALDRNKKQVVPMTQEEVMVFLETCQTSVSYKEYYPLFLCAFRTGMRMGELLGLQWGDIDWNGRFIVVQRSFKNGLINLTKNGKTRRVDMSDQLTNALFTLYTKRKEEALASNDGKIVETIFHKNKKPMAQNSLRNIFKGVLRKAKLRDMRYHDIRHTYASLLLSSGQSPVYVKEQMGHSSINITVDIYGHLIPNSNRDAVNMLDNMTPNGTPMAPAEKEKGTTLMAMPFVANMVPKRGIEPPQEYSH